MTKVAGSYESVVRGVSQQVPQDRRPGQHFEQVNMISDPVRGLARRHGSLLQDEKVVVAYNAVTHAKWLADTARHKVFTFFVGGVEYDLIYRSQADSQALGTTTFAFGFNKDMGKIIPVVMAADTTTLAAGGVSACVNVGKYVFLAGNTIVPGYTPTDKCNVSSNYRYMVAWIRGGEYSRTYKVTVTKTDNTKVTVSYKTMPSSYQTLLNTSDILSSDPEYQKKVNDRVNAYNAAVTQYIGLAAADITPENIATKLSQALTTAGVTGSSVVQGHLVLDNASYKEIATDDGGDQTLMYGVGMDVQNIDLVSTVHRPGKIVRIRPKKNNGEDALYLMAVAKDGVTSGTFTEVTWKEVAGYEMLPTKPFAIATVVNETVYIAAEPASLNALITPLGAAPCPSFKTNQVGDDLTSPLPYFINRKIDYLGLFQDRLVIGSGAVLFFSRPGDYFNWFKSSVLAPQDNDPVEMYALGSEDDTIKTSTTYDRNLFLFGRRKQYTVNGRAPLTPRSASIVITGAHEDAVDSEPINSGNFVFYAKTRNGITSVHQIQQGTLADSPESFNVSQQLDRYIKGKPVESVAVTAPNCVIVRTDDNRSTLYTYAYLDTATGNERLFDSWSKWTWSTTLGDIIGLSRHDGDILVYCLRKGKDKDNADKVWLVCDRFVLDSGLSPRPYLDSLRLMSNVTTPTANSFINANTTSATETIHVAFGEGANAYLGTTFARRADFATQYPTSTTAAWAGVAYPAYVTPTNPYMRDRNDKVIVNGRLTLGRLNITVADTGGFTVETTSTAGTKKTADFSGRLLGRSTNLVGVQPIVTTVVPASIGREVREVTYTIAAKTFLPLTVTAIEWIGQYFNNTSQRV